MKTKIIPFDVEMAEKIQAGEIEGKIKTRCGYAARILCTDLMGQAQPVLAAFITGKSESESHYTKRGFFYINGEFSDLDLVLEVPDTEPEFKPFDKVLVRNKKEYPTTWHAELFSHILHDRDLNDQYVGIGGVWDECISYAGNEQLVGTTDKPNEE